MTFAQLKELLAGTVQRADLTPRLGDFLNAALRDIQTAHSWTRMRTSAVVTLAAGGSSVALPANFKELVGATNSVYRRVSGLLQPVDVVSEAAERRRLWASGGSAPDEFRVFLGYAAEGVSLGVVRPLTEDAILEVRYYGFFDDLVDDSDTNWFLEGERWLMVLARAKQLCFEFLNDEMALRVGGQAGELVKDSAGADAGAEFAGRADASHEVFRRRLVDAIRKDARAGKGGLQFALGQPEPVALGDSGKP